MFLIKFNIGVVGRSGWLGWENVKKVRGSKVHIGNLKENMNYIVNGPGWSRIDYI